MVVAVLVFIFFIMMSYKRSYKDHKYIDHPFGYHQAIYKYFKFQVIVFYNYGPKEEFINRIVNNIQLA